MSTAKPAEDDRGVSPTPASCLQRLGPDWQDRCGVVAAGPRLKTGKRVGGSVTAASTRRLDRRGAYRIDLTLGSSNARAELAGDIDLLAVPDLTRLMDSLDMLELPIIIDLAEVTFLDSAGVAPLVVAARRRERAGLPPVLIGQTSQSARYLFDVTHLGGNPRLDLARWDRLTPAAATCGGTR